MLWLQLSRMFRGSQRMIGSCPLRLQLRVTESISIHVRCHLNRSLHDGVIGRRTCWSLPTGTATYPTKHSFFNPNCGNRLRQEALVQNLKSTDPTNSPCKRNKTVNTQDSNTPYHPPQRRFWDNSRLHSINSTTYCRHFCSRQKEVFGFLQRLEHVHTRAQAYSLSSHQTRTVHGVWTECLSLENENRCRQKLAPNLKLYSVEKGRKAQGQEKFQGRWASILVSLCSERGEPAFLFTLRSSMLKGRHKGDVSFAGGKSDPSDSDVIATALREAWEELGINVPTESVWGVLKPLRDTSGMMVAPVLANVGPLEELSFKPNPGEVEEIFSLPLSHLCDPQNCGYTHFRTGDKYGYTLPVFRNGKHRVWGLTAVALDLTLKLLIPSHLQ